MPIPTFFIEFLQRIEAAQVTLAGRSTVSFTFTPNSITYHSATDTEQRGSHVAEGVQICHWITPRLNIRSCREMKVTTSEGLSMRFKIASEDTQWRDESDYPVCPGFLVPKDELAEYGDEECQLSLRCGFCHSQLTLKE